MCSFHGVVGSLDDGKLHHVTEKLVAFEYVKPNTPSRPHSLVFVGGLGDGLGTVPYLKTLSAAVANTQWSLFSLILNSSYEMWGMGRLGRDVEDIAQGVEYITKYKKSLLPDQAPKIVVMGHSTGSQDVLHYLYSPNPLPIDPIFDEGLLHIHRPALDGAIMQAPASDREGLLEKFHDKGKGAEQDGVYLQLVDMAKRVTYAEGNTHDVLLPLSLTSKLGFPPVPLSARRFLSLVSPDSPENPEEDDVFSSDLTDKRLDETFGMIVTRNLLKTKLLVLYSGDDEYVPKSLDKEKLLQRWKKAADKSFQKIWDDEYSGVVPGASHNLGGDGQDQARRNLAARVTGYLANVEKSA
ncbi:hypothetical protein BGW36DRAFT_398581 [Talaromyces proteolyticus]|uniref:Dolichol-phosphate mannosyltransferase n=1 Tax=Talaromyces proteolyticus TaxID=1131652 RepID=A0AAD4KT28_9EURO|nr:uncharacterized protein BGW36DRAFT_398581 [Talaromyces proteolyticus]KAH8695330.1 hypothetical protein BGW36DRAFT_398581 [Talaromyces proteolyticus]